MAGLDLYFDLDLARSSLGKCLGNKGTSYPVPWIGSQGSVQWAADFEDRPKDNQS